jgi:hypothetical protein
VTTTSPAGLLFRKPYRSGGSASVKAMVGALIVTPATSVVSVIFA